MKKKKVVKTLGAMVLCTSLLAPTFTPSVFAQETTSHHHDYSISGFMTHEQMAKRLKQIERTSQGRVQVEVVGESNRGRDIYMARVGTGDRVVLIQSEIHGNEKTGTEAIMNMLQQLGNNSRQSQKIRDELTIVFMPKMNPDGAEMDKRRNDMTWAEVVEAFPQLSNASAPAWNYLDRGVSQSYNYAENPGFDVNRDFNPNLNYVPQPEDFPGRSAAPGWFITPEAQASRDVYKGLLEEFGNVDVFVDLHHQGIYYVEGTDDRVTLSISGQFVQDPNTEQGAKYQEYKEKYNYDFSRQLNVAIYDALNSIGNSPFGNVTLYSQGLDLPGTALGTYALNGSGTVLFEVTGQTQNFGQKERGKLVKAVERGLYGIIDGMVDGSVYEIDPEEYENIPLTSRWPASGSF
ncbi:M14 family zinc carboxypeptidase [Alkalihalobacterium chitinilyticum]|uniref:M14 family zinc carboxypeptidase n=1 Tax=Alkalihalobacterium chitinilyticum TaxID=2980103 RepID=A0ABT5VBJ9_9BACI|nr:M14 family zinc carboxypeptidase [Alkalihalobacterium chitinilyticum]MDE5412849.1 M14 family zinc carboxypeptidase [Alkalihalobacterium chitinilyticum]